MAAPCRTAIIHRKNNVALLCHELMPQEIGAAPGVSNHLTSRPAVGIYEHGIFLLRIEVCRLDDAGVKHHSIPRLHVDKFHRRKMVVRKLCDFVFVNRSDARAVGMIEVLARRCRGTRISIVESSDIGRRHRRMRAFVLGDPGKI